MCCSCCSCDRRRVEDGWDGIPETIRLALSVSSSPSNDVLSYTLAYKFDWDEGQGTGPRHNNRPLSDDISQVKLAVRIGRDL